MSEEWKKDGQLARNRRSNNKASSAGGPVHPKDGALARLRNGLFTHMTETEAHLGLARSLARCPGIKGHHAAASPPCMQFQTKHLLLSSAID